MGPITGGYLSTTAGIRWTINGVIVAGATTSHLDAQYVPGDVVQAQVRIWDSLGVGGPWVSSNAVTVAAAQLRASDAVPGGPVVLSGQGFAADELVDIHLGASDGELLGTVSARSRGSFEDKVVALAIPAPGGENQAFGVGQTSGTVSAPASFMVSPGAAGLDPADLAAGQSTTFAAYGFVPGEDVAVAFPGQDPVTGVADESGTFVVGLISPALPAPGGEVTASADSGSTAADYTTVPVVATVGTPLPGAVKVSATGFAPLEWVILDLEGIGATAVLTDAAGSGRTTLTRPTVFGDFVLTATGSQSGLTDTITVSIHASVTLTPNAGRPGVVVTVTSGPGWLPLTTVEVYFDSQPAGSLQTSVTGEIDDTWVVPNHAAGLVVFELRDSILGVTARAWFTVTG